MRKERRGKLFTGDTHSTGGREHSQEYSRVHGELFSRVERESRAAQRGRRRQIYRESFRKQAATCTGV